jgi:hypothetical protein
MNGFKRVQEYKMPESTADTSIDDLKRLAGVNNTSYGEETSEYATNLGQIQRERNIRPGTDEWFKLWFAKPLLTGEQPYTKK